VPDRLDVAVVGAGPFGLSVAAHLPERAVRVFGEPMQTWRTRMPPDMLLRSDWEETSLSAPRDQGAIDVWSRASGGFGPIARFVSGSRFTMHRAREALDR
jgi:cation diffusion facilitator CzcD-associated flavoprotein CzcO